MKRHVKIIIRNELLKNLRDNLRKVIINALNHQISNIDEKYEDLFDVVAETGDIPDELADLEEKKQLLNRSFNESICICNICQKMDKDMVYATRPAEWFCIDCYENKLPKNMQEKWEPKYPLSKDQVLEFLNELKNVVEQCNTNLNLSKKILTKMGITKKDQKIFLDTVYQYGGHCDCEIMMNAYPNIMADFNLDIE